MTSWPFDDLSHFSILQCTGTVKYYPYYCADGKGHYAPGCSALHEKEISCYLRFPWYFPEKVPKFHEKSFPFNEFPGKSRSGSSAASCYCVEKCVIFTQATITVSQWTQLGHMAQDPHTPNWRKPFPSGSLSQIPWVFPEFLNSFSRFSLISRVAGNPVQAVKEIWEPAPAPQRDWMFNY